MRRYKFRGIRVGDHDVVCGDLCTIDLPDFYIVSWEDGLRHKIIIGTESQYTGYKDEQEVEIYEGDNVINEFGEVGIVVREQGAWVVKIETFMNREDVFFLHELASDLRVIGHAWVL